MDMGIAAIAMESSLIPSIVNYMSSIDLPRPTMDGPLKRYGMLNADNGMDWALSIAPDQRIPVMHEELRKVQGF